VVEPRQSSLRAFRHRNFQVLYPANLISNIGSWAQRIAQDWLVLQLTHSAQDLGFVTALQFLPTLALSTWGGWLADKFSKRLLLVYTNLAAGITSFLLGFLVITNSVSLWQVYVLAFALGVANAVDAPIRQSFNVELVGVGDVASAISWNSANFNAGRLIGPAVSGFLIQYFGTGPSFLINSASYLIVIVAILFIRPNDLYIPERADSAGTIAEAYRYVRSRPDLIWVMAGVFTSATFGLNFQIFTAIMSTQVFHKQASDFGILGTALAIGSLSGALLAGRLETYRLPPVILGIMVLFGVALGFLSFSPTYLSFGLTLPFCGVLALVSLISANSYVQTTTDNSLRGRVMGIYLLIFMGGTPIGSTALGWMAQSYGIRPTILVCGLITAVSALIFWWRLRVWQRTGGLAVLEPASDAGNG
jgi:MFS family permease